MYLTIEMRTVGPEFEESQDVDELHCDHDDASWFMVVPDVKLNA